MSDQSEIIDSQLEPNPKPQGFYQNRAIIYLVLMLGGGLIYAAFFSTIIVNIFIDAFIYTISAILVAIPLEIFRKHQREKRNKKKNRNVIDDPLWFHIIESALSLLILIIIFAFILGN